MSPITIIQYQFTGIKLIFCINIKNKIKNTKIRHQFITDLKIVLTVMNSRI